MQWQHLALLCCVLAPAVLGSPIGHEVDEPIVEQKHHSLLGAKECTWGPSYWCYNITNAKGCNAVTHCIQTVWEKHTVPEDHDSICDICLNMVQQARDQLQSNATQEDLKAVFEGSCKLIPIRLVADECINLVDDFIPELVEALSSQMNPQAVCSVAGLCNNAAIDRMLEGEAAKQTSTPALAAVAAVDSFDCNKCRTISGIISQNFHNADRDYLVEAMLRQCRRMSSFSDACSNIVLTYFNEIYANMKSTLNQETICHMTGVCSAQFHQHEEDEQEEDKMPTTLAATRVIPAQGDDIPCELCKQLVHHLKELLIANTTEIEFKQVLEGLCKQTKSFQSECLSIVDNYYIQIYQALLTNLNENEACCAIEICPRGLAAQAAMNAQIAPLLPALNPVHLDVLITEKPRLTKKNFLGEGEPVLSETEILSAQLPFDTLNAPNSNMLIEGGNFCLICQYAANYVKTELADTTVDDEIKDVLKKMCTKAPSKYTAICDTFVDTYGDAFIALLVEEVDPDTICPKMFMCPAGGKSDVEVLFPVHEEMDAGITVNGGGRSGTEKCPMCLFAVAQAQAAVKSDKSTSNIKRVLNGLCTHLPTKMQLECTDFVETYTKELVNMLANDFTPDAICVQLSLCDPKKETKPDFLEDLNGAGDIETNQITDLTFNGELVTSILVDNEMNPNCLLCEEVVKQVEKRVMNKKSREQIKEALEHVCGKMHKIEQKCTAIVDKYGDRIVDLIIAEFTPKQICRELGMCIVMMDISMERMPTQQFIDSALDKFFEPSKADAKQVLHPKDAYVTAGDTTLCVICQTVMTQLENELKDKTTQKEIVDTVMNICHTLPKSFDEQCSTFIKNYATLIIALIDTTPPKTICGQLNLCSPPALGESKFEVMECAVCHSATQELAHLLEDPKSEKSVEHIMEAICTKLPGKYYDRCVKMIRVYGHSMMNIISRSGELETVCTQIGMCYPDEYASFAQVVAMDEL